MGQLIRKLAIFLLFFTITACAGSGLDEDDEFDEDPDPGLSALGSSVKLTYQFSNQLSTDDGDFPEFVYPTEYEATFYIKDDGEVSLRAKDFPRMVLRICPSDTTMTDCDILFDNDAVSFGIDLVLDLCGDGLDHDDCGDSDPTIFKGTLTSEGRLVIPTIAVRSRIFLVGTSGPDGRTADDTDSGILPTLPRLITVVRTDPAIETGELEGIGERVNDRSVKLVAGGIIPDGMPELGGAHYLSTITGTFDVDPLSFLE